MKKYLEVTKLTNLGKLTVSNFNAGKKFEIILADFLLFLINFKKCTHIVKLENYAYPIRLSTKYLMEQNNENFRLSVT